MMIIDRNDGDSGKCIYCSVHQRSIYVYIKEYFIYIIYTYVVILVYIVIVSYFICQFVA